MNQAIILLISAVLLASGFFVINKVSAPVENTPNANQTENVTVPLPTETTGTNSGTPASNTSTDAPAVNAPVITITPAPETKAPVKEFTITGSNFAYAPNSIKVKKGDKVRIIFKNADGFHDLKIDELNVSTAKIQGGAQETIEFTADKVGSFEYYCSVGSHRQMGMKGTLVVE